MASLQVTQTSEVTPIVAFSLTNSCSLTNLFPQLRDGANPSKVLWDARYDTDGFDYVLLATQITNVSLHIAKTKIKGKSFFISCCDRNGNGEFLMSKRFLYDEDSRNTAHVEATGRKGEITMKFKDMTVRPEGVVYRLASSRNDYAEETLGLLQSIKDGRIKNQ